MKIIGSAYEHDAIYKHLDTVVKSLGELERVLQDYSKEDKIVFWMLTNNITGTVYNTKEIGRLCHRYGAYYIMDCTASIGHNSIPEGVEDYCDCLITSAHKYHGPSGIGCMWVSDRFASFLGLTDDDHDEYGLIPGTPNVSGAVAMECAMDHAIDVFNHGGWDFYYELMDWLRWGLESNHIKFRLIKDRGDTYAINAITLPGFNADALVQFLSSRGVYVSAGHSACSGDSPDASRVLEAFGLTKEEASQTVRISFCEDSTLEEVDMLVNGIAKFKEKFMD